MSVPSTCLEVKPCQQVILQCRRRFSELISRTHTAGCLFTCEFAKVSTVYVCLQALHPLIQAAEADATKDNAAGAVARMISSFSSQLPLEQVLPGLLSKSISLRFLACNLLYPLTS